MLIISLMPSMSLFLCSQLCVLMPLVSTLPGKEGEGIHEDAMDTLSMIASSRPLQILLAADMLALLLYNVTGMLVTGALPQARIRSQRYML